LHLDTRSFSFHEQIKMNVEIITKTLRFNLYGFSGKVTNNDYVGAAFVLADKMWRTVKSMDLKNKGQNIWVYESKEKVFAGVELYDTPTHDSRLEQKNITLIKYAYYKHIGSYALIKQAGQMMTNELQANGYEILDPYLEIYGHWTEDETKLETELLMSLE